MLYFQVALNAASLSVLLLNHVHSQQAVVSLNYLLKKVRLLHTKPSVQVCMCVIKADTYIKNYICCHTSDSVNNLYLEDRHHCDSGGIDAHSVPGFQLLT